MLSVSFMGGQGLETSGVPWSSSTVSVSFLGGQVLEVPVRPGAVTKDLRLAVAAARGVEPQQVRLVKDGETLMDHDDIPADATAESFIRALIPRAPRNWYLHPRYTLRTFIGPGAYSSVCEAVDTFTGLPVAIKRIRNIFDDLADANLILRELVMLKALEHDCVVRLRDAFAPPPSDALHEAGVELNEVYVVMELCDSDMRALIKTDVELSVEHVRLLTYNLLRGLKYLHSAGVCHGDLKPANCLVNQDCSVKLADMDLSCVEREQAGEMPSRHNVNGSATIFHRQINGHVVGCCYTAPEIILPLTYTWAADVWSTGCILAELLQLLPGGPPVMERAPLFPRTRNPLGLIFDVLGTPSDAMLARISRADARSYVETFATRRGEGFQSRFEYVGQDTFDLLSKLVRLDPEERITIDDALNHHFLASCRNVTLETVATSNINLVLEQANGFSEDHLSRHFIDHIRSIQGGA